MWQTKLLLGLKIILSGYTINLLKGLKIGERGHGRRLKKLLLGLKIFWRRTPKKKLLLGLKIVERRTRQWTRRRPQKTSTGVKNFSVADKTSTGVKNNIELEHHETSTGVKNRGTADTGKDLNKFLLGLKIFWEVDSQKTGERPTRENTQKNFYWG